MIITFVTNKGGTGRSTLSYLLSREIMRKNSKLLIIDLDEQTNLTIALGMKPKTGFYKINENTDLLVAENTDKISLEGYEYVVIDNSPSITDKVRWSINVADKIVSPIVMEKFSVVGLMKIMNIIDKSKLVVIPNMYIANTKLHSEIFNQAKEYMEKHNITIAEPIPRRIGIAEAVSNGGFIDLGLLEVIENG